MPRFSTRSSERLETCDERLQILFREVVKTYDCSIICGHRNAKDQNAAYNAKNSKLRWPDSKHNDYLSRAVDVVPYPDGWDSSKQFYYMAGYIMATASRLGYSLRWGGNWDGDNDLDDNGFMDLGHWEILR